MTLSKSQADLFNFVRNEDVVLFIGAGFSAYAGYPLGSNLAGVLYELLPNELKVIDLQKSLDQYTDALVRKCGSRVVLNNLLDQVFLASPTSNADHDHLATIPHFKTIITTNYDTLFEDAYGEKGNLMWLDEHMSRWDDKKVNIIKIHGHITDKNSIILTQEDYSTFITKDFSSPLWTAVLNQIGTKHILFIGYGYEDPNIWALVKKLRQQLGDSKKRMFLIGRGSDPEKIAFFNSKDIEYIQQSSRTFLDALCEDIKDNLISDLESKRVSAETARAFSRLRNASLVLEDTAQGYKLKAIRPINEKDETWNAKFTYQSDGETMERVKSFQNSVETLEIRLDANELENFKLVFEGFKLMDQADLGYISVKKIPKKAAFDLTFLTEGWEANGLEAHIYAVKGAVSLLSTVFGLQMKVNLSIDEGRISGAKFDFKRPDQYGLLNDEIGLYSLLLYFFSQKDFTLFFGGGASFTCRCPDFQNEFVGQCEDILNYLGWLKLIEKTFRTRFGTLDTISEDSWSTAKLLAEVIQGKRFSIKGQCTLNAGEPDDDAMAYFENLNNLLVDGPLEFFIRQDTTFSLHEQHFICRGKQIFIDQPMIDNFDAVKSGRDKALLFSSRSDTMWEQLTIESASQLNE